MAKKYHINEIDIFKFIADTFNDNTTDGKVKFSIGYYYMDDGAEMGGFTRRFAQDGGRFDVKKTMSNDTYELDDTSFVPMSIPMLNSNYLAHDIIKEITYEPTIEFLVYAENVLTFRAIELAIQEIRARLVQYQTTLDVSYINIDDTSGANITETLKVIAMSGEINYGQLIRVAGKNYLTLSMPLVLEVTNHGEYANQETHYLSVPSVSEGAFIQVHPIAWNWGTGVDTEGSQFLNDKLIGNQANAKYVRHVPKTTGFAYAMGIQIDFNNQILKKIFIDSRKPTQETSTELWTLKSEIAVYDSGTKTYIVDNDMTISEECLLDRKAPIEEVSKGEKYIFSLSFVPSWNKGV